MTGRWMPVLASLLSLGAGGCPGVRKVGPSARLFRWGCGGFWVRWCQDLGCRGGGPGGGSAVLLGRARALVLPGHHGRVGGVVAGVRRSVALVMSNRRLPCLDTYFDKALIYLWPRFKIVFDMYIQSLYQCDAKMLWVDGTHPHHIVRCYMEFTASLIQLNAECGDGQLDMSLKRLRLAVDDLLVRFAEKFATQKLQHLFLLNNCDMAISILKPIGVYHAYLCQEAGEEAKELRRYFEEKLESNLVSFVDELLMEYFGDLIKFVKNHISEDLISYTECPKIADVELVVKNFAVKWRTALELMHNEVVTCCSNFVSGMAILKAAMAQLLNDYNRLSECVKMIPGSIKSWLQLSRGQGIWCDTLGLTFPLVSVDVSLSIGEECMTPNLFWIRMLPPQFSREVRGKEYDRQILWLGRIRRNIVDWTEIDSYSQCHPDSDSRALRCPPICKAAAPGDSVAGKFA
ncbi:unnamed protein product [Triticum turgidum subsp. durum]|uniref:Vps52 C-terminal domain-containing protein n=1 Tax=Triticum turgidum subsp. durum TaxID=4567 RepID=A0A9R0Q796_TRITD|nr:unnamed protein product [Triticum turgidum subsp. durum]